MTLDKSNSLDTPTLVWSLIYTFFSALHRSKGFVPKLKNRRKKTGIQLHGFCTPIDCRTMSPWYHNSGCFFFVFVVQSFYEGFDFPTQFPVPLYLGLLCTKVAENNSKTPTKRASAWRSGVWIKDTRPESTMHRTRFVSPWKKRCPTRGRGRLNQVVGHNCHWWESGAAHSEAKNYRGNRKQWAAGLAWCEWKRKRSTTRNHSLLPAYYESEAYKKKTPLQRGDRPEEVSLDVWQQGNK